MSKSRLVSGKQKKKSGASLDADRYDYLDVSNAEPDLGLPLVDDSVLIGDTDGTRTWVDLTTYANDFRGYTGSQGDIGYTGSVGFAGSQGDIGYTGSQGDIGYTGSQGDIGFTGSQGDIGYTGSQGDIGYTGSFGFTGSQGDIGYTGSQGDIGYTGSFGFTGSQGPQGNFGGVTFDYTFDSDITDSAPGTGKLKLNQNNISTASVLYIQDTDDNNANLDAYLTTIDASTSQLKGHIRISNKSNSDDFAIFAIINNSTNNGAYFSVPVSYVSGTASSFSNNEDIIITFARTGDKGDIGYTGSRGDTGYTGSQGDIGYTGSKGDIGFTGSQGEAGYIGADGYAGSQGFTGSQGYTGSQGDIGYTGSQGDIGYTGSQGDIGYTGSQGDVGYVGSQGDIGYTGSQGDIGYTGSQGDIGYTGSQGDIGYTGSQGDIGYTGSQGTTGFVGSQGDIGYTGSQGDIGYTGSQGDIGYTGSQGDIGYTGSQGDIGYTGSQGDTGFVGSQGDLGYTGSQGDIGYTGSQGNAGTQGFTGSQGVGFTGSKGLAGNFGGATFGYNFNTTTTLNVNPGSGKFAVNDSDLSLVTTIAISRFDYYTTDIKSYLLTVADSSSTIKGYLKFTSQANPQTFTFYSITGSVIDNSSWVNLTITYVTGSTLAFPNNEDMFLTFSRTGDIGSEGYTGSVGFTGSQGIPGEFAALGYTGSRGYTGSAGTDGTSVEIVGTVASSANLPNPYNGSIGDGYITADTGNLWIWTGSSWTNVGRIVGYTGSAGPAGGYTGSAGSPGPLGFTGSAGAGFTGSQGASGSLYVSMGMSGLITTPFVGTSKFYPPKNINMYAVYANVSVAATSGPFTFIVKKNGVSIGTTFTIAQNQNIMTPANINVNLLTTDYITIDATGASATDLFVKIEYINT